MTKKQKEELDIAIANMKYLINEGDVEQNHANADILLCKVLNAFGCQELTELFDKVVKYYA